MRVFLLAPLIALGALTLILLGACTSALLLFTLTLIRSFAP